MNTYGHDGIIQSGGWYLTSTEQRDEICEEKG